MRLAIEKLLKFYDDDDEATKHANAIKTVAGEELGLALLVQHLMERNPGTVAKVLDCGCTTGNRTTLQHKAYWLDGWVIERSTSRSVCYQVEVKSWSYHGLGSRKNDRLPLETSPESLSEYKRRAWHKYWDEEAGTFRATGLRKVLQKMEPKAEVMQFFGTAPLMIEPVACVWLAMHPEGMPEPLFRQDLANGPFPQVNVFSMSSYLRNCLESGRTELALDLPKTERRLEFLSGLFR